MTPPTVVSVEWPAPDWLSWLVVAGAVCLALGLALLDAAPSCSAGVETR